VTGQELRALRRGWTLTLNELASMLGVTWVTLQRAETGVIKIPRAREKALKLLEPVVVEWLQNRVEVLNKKLEFTRDQRNRKRIYKELIRREEALEKLQTSKEINWKKD
jgi:predicted transcriptional regulator